MHVSVCSTRNIRLKICRYLIKSSRYLCYFESVQRPVRVRSLGQRPTGGQVKWVSMVVNTLDSVKILPCDGAIW